MFDYQWQDCDLSGQNCADTGTTRTRTRPPGSDVGDKIDVIVTATQRRRGCEPRPPRPTGKVLPAAPTNTVLPLISGTARSRARR